MVDNSWVQAKEERWRQTLSLQEQLVSPSLQADLSPHQSLQSQPVPAAVPQQPSTPVQTPILQTPNLHAALFQPPSPDPQLALNPAPSPIPNLKNNTPYVVITHDEERPENAPIEFTQLQPSENETQIDALFLSGGITNVINLVPKLKRRLGMVQDQATQTDVVTQPEQQDQQQNNNQKFFQKTDTKQIDDLLKRLFAQSVMKVPDEKKTNGNSNSVKSTNNGKKQSQKTSQKVSNSDVKKSSSRGRQGVPKQKQEGKKVQQEQGEGGQNEDPNLPSNQNSSNKPDLKDLMSEVQSEKSTDNSKVEKSVVSGVSATGMNAVNDVMAALCGERYEVGVEGADPQKSNALWTC